MYCTPQILPHQRDGQLSVMKAIRPANVLSERVTRGGDAGEVVLGSAVGCMLDGGVADAEE